MRLRTWTLTFSLMIAQLTRPMKSLSISAGGPPKGVNRSESGCRDLNPGPLDPQSSALTKLRHSPHSVRPTQSSRTAEDQPSPTVEGDHCNQTCNPITIGRRFPRPAARTAPRPERHFRVQSCRASQSWATPIRSRAADPFEVAPSGVADPESCRHNDPGHDRDRSQAAGRCRDSHHRPWPRHRGRTGGTGIPR
jgi:hypothetical protein